MAVSPEPRRAFPVQDRVLRVHIGFHKTGTSSLQVALSDAAGKGLLPVLYPVSGRLAGWPHAHHQMVADIQRGHTAGLASLVAECAADPRPVVLISAEDFGTVEAIFALSELSRALPGHALEVVAVVRNHVDWIRSFYMERVKRCVTLLDPMDHFRELMALRLYAPVLKAARGFGARLHILPYLGDRLEERLFPILTGIAMPEGGPLHRHNASLSAETTMALLGLYRAGLAREVDIETAIRNAYALEARLDRATLSREVFSAEEILAIHRHYALDRAQVNELAGAEVLPDAPPRPLGEPVRPGRDAEIGLLRRLLSAC